MRSSPRLHKFLSLEWRERRDLLVALVDLAAARIALGQSLTPSASAPSDGPSASDLLTADRIGLAVRRMSAVVPWRSDCLVQARAVRRRLDRHNIASTLHIGVNQAETFQAHAWLCVGAQPIVGGQSGDYHRLHSIN